MLKPRIYLDTSVISYLTALPAKDTISLGRQEMTKEWWQKQKETVEPFISVYVIEEIMKGDPQAAKKRMDFVLKIPVLKTNHKIEKFSEALLFGLNIPSAAMLDAYHLATAALHELDLVVSWNFKHMANTHVRKMYRAYCMDEMLIAPEITTPEELLGEEK